MFQLLRDQTRGLVNRLFFNHFSSYCEEIKSVKFWISKWKTSHGINQGELFPTVYMYTKHRGGVRVLESVASHKYLFLGKHEEVFCNTVETMCPLFPLVFFVSTSEACYTAQCLTKSPLELRTRLALCAIGPATQHMRQQWIFSILHRLELVGLRRLLKTLGHGRCPPASDNSYDDSKHSFYTKRIYFSVDWIAPINPSVGIQFFSFTFLDFGTLLSKKTEIFNQVKRHFILWFYEKKHCYWRMNSYKESRHWKRGHSGHVSKYLIF